MKTSNKLSKTLLAVAAIAALAAPVSAASRFVSGGVWTYGAGGGGAFSNYYHGQRRHSSTVVSLSNSKSKKAWAKKEQTSKAFIPTKFGERAAFYYGVD